MRILVVEDEELLAASLKRGLQAEDFEVDVVHDGLEGLWRAREWPYAAIVLDILLPGLNGYKVARQLRDAEVWTPILMLTAKDGEYDEVDALEYGADDFLRKPFSFLVLVARLRALIRRGSVPRPDVLTCGALRYDPATRRCYVDESEKRLTAREADLLDALMRYSGQTVRKADLLDRVWGGDYEGDTNAVEVYIGYLRRKLGPDRIETVRGVGYRLVDPDA
ncbi:MAG: response regulator transcription factor [Nitriliruptorales bacterium]